MRKVKLYIAVSLDGYIARPDGSVDWLDSYNDVDYGYRTFTDSVDCAILGHGTYQKSLSFGVDVFKDRIHYVFTRSPEPKDWGNVQFVREAPEAFVRRLRSTEGKHAWMMGGGVLLNAFLAAKLIDEMMIFVIPEIIGAGIPLFPGPTTLHRIPIVNTEEYSNGVVLLHYQNRS